MTPHRLTPFASQESDRAMKLFRVLLPVSDIEQAAAFYGAIFNTSGERVSPGRHYFDCEGTILACFDPRADGDDYEAAPNPEWLYFAVKNLEEIHQRIEGAGGKLCRHEVHGAVAGEIAVRPWGERSFYARDPFGNKISFVDHVTMFTGL